MNDLWRDKLINFLIIFIDWGIPIGGIGGYIIYKFTHISFFKWVGIISFIPIGLMFVTMVVFFIVSFIIYCFSSLIPHRNNTPSFMEFDEKLPWWGAILWLVIIFIFLSHTIPILLHNIGIYFGLVNGQIVSIEDSIDQNTLWGLFKSWVIGERNLQNSIVSWSIILSSLSIMTGIGFLFKKVWQSLNKIKR